MLMHIIRCFYYKIAGETTKLRDLIDYKSILFFGKSDDSRRMTSIYLSEKVSLWNQSIIILLLILIKDFSKKLR